MSLSSIQTHPSTDIALASNAEQKTRATHAYTPSVLFPSPSSLILDEIEQFDNGITERTFGQTQDLNETNLIENFTTNYSSPDINDITSNNTFSPILFDSFLTGIQENKNDTTLISALFSPKGDNNNNSTLFAQHANTSNLADLLEDIDKMIVIDKKPLEQLPLPEMLASTIIVCFKIAIIIGGALPYLPQYLEIRRRKNASGFSTYVCLTLLIANILRIEFWVIRRFDVALLIQSILMILTMLVMLEISVRMNKRHVSIVQRVSLWKLDFMDFWQWNDLSSYILVTIVFVVITSILTSIFYAYVVYVEVLGSVALVVEACLGMPQLYKNCKRRSTLGMNAKMVIMWLIGDIGKTIYYFISKVPVQFYACSFIQITIDCLILIQVWVFGRQTLAQQRLPLHLHNGLSSKTSI